MWLNFDNLQALVVCFAMGKMTVLGIQGTYKGALKIKQFFHSLECWYCKKMQCDFFLKKLQGRLIPIAEKPCSVTRNNCCQNQPLKSWHFVNIFLLLVEALQPLSHKKGRGWESTIFHFLNFIGYKKWRQIQIAFILQSQPPPTLSNNQTST